MIFLADESTDFNIISLLREHEFYVVAIKEVAPGSNDESILELCSRQQHILITEDKDFGDLVYHFQFPHNGIILVRCNEMPNKAKAKRVIDAIKIHKDDLINCFTVITPAKIRIRKK
jgi:predicted nuclease of predicted toxin-antitoxin system